MSSVSWINLWSLASPPVTQTPETRVWSKCGAKNELTRWELTTTCITYIKIWACPPWKNTMTAKPHDRAMVSSAFCVNDWYSTIITLWLPQLSNLCSLCRRVYQSWFCFPQTYWNVTVENCSAGAVCWEEGNLTWTEMNTTTVEYLEKCKRALTTGKHPQKEHLQSN